MSGEPQYVAELPEYIRLGGVTGSGASRSMSIAGGTNPILGKPLALVFVRVSQQKVAGRYVPVSRDDNDVNGDMNSAAWPMAFDRYVKNGFQVSVPDSYLQGTYPGVLLIVVYSQAHMGSPTTPRFNFTMMFDMTKGSGPPSVPSYETLEDGAKKEVEALLKEPVDQLSRGVIARPGN